MYYIRIYIIYPKNFHLIYQRIIIQYQDHSFLDTGDLLYYGGVEWLNISDFLGKIKKGLELHAMCFVFKSAVVFLCKERLRQKKKLMVNREHPINLIKIYEKPLYLFTFYAGRFE